MMKFSPQKQKFIDSATEMFGAGSILQKKDVVAASKSAVIPTDNRELSLARKSTLMASSSSMVLIEPANGILCWIRADVNVGTVTLRGCEP